MLGRMISLSIILYTINCPKCTILEKKLKQKNIEYTTCSDLSTIKELGINVLPVLSINGVLHDFKSAVDYINGV